ncbi:hypothetical protein NLJ89_g5825 [Agrocybe chaxingu]|uniref:Uncharacterized protein n=1 Tax=Agrocybe chaxingu TaxID=84603 RepID=A0A9W8JXR6_9AGAR|nr:hypothetical protein NLJ89_g5825 [Agrocybe chaxingu]
MHRAGPRQPSSRSKYSPVHEHRSIALCSWSLAPERNAYSFTPLTLLPSIDALANPTPTAVLSPKTSDITSPSNLVATRCKATPTILQLVELQRHRHRRTTDTSREREREGTRNRGREFESEQLQARELEAHTGKGVHVALAYFFPTRKSASSPLLADFQSHPPPPPYSESRIPPLPYTHQPLWKNASPVIPSPPTNLFTSTYMHSDTEDDDEMIYTSRLRPHSHSGSNSNSHSHSSTSLRSRIFGLASTAGGSGGHSRGRSDRDREQGKLICTTPGERCAGETETETDEPSRHLPTARIIPSSGPLIPPHTLQQTLTPFLFEFARFLSVVPAIFGTLYNLYHIYAPPPPLPPNISGRPPADRLDFWTSGERLHPCSFDPHPIEAACANSKHEVPRTALPSLSTFSLSQAPLPVCEHYVSQALLPMHSVTYVELP